MLDIAAVNGFSLPLHGKYAFVLGLYRLISMIEHSCIPVCIHHSVSAALAQEGTESWDVSPAEIVLRSRQEITVGTLLSTSYVSLDYPLMKRQKILMDSKSFHCSCTRCKDPSEHGSNLAALQCGCGGLLQPPLHNPDYFLSALEVPSPQSTSAVGGSTQTTTFKTDYTCSACGSAMPASIAAKRTDEASRAWDEVQARVAAMASSLEGIPPALQLLRRMRQVSEQERGGAVFVSHHCNREMCSILLKIEKPSEIAAREAVDVHKKALVIAEVIRPARDPQLLDLWRGLGKAYLALLPFCDNSELVATKKSAFRAFSLAAENAHICFGTDSSAYVGLKTIIEEYWRVLSMPTAARQHKTDMDYSALDLTEQLKGLFRSI